MIHEGYGGLASLEEHEEILGIELVSPWVRRMVVAVVWDRNLWDDCVQEAKIAMWRAAPEWTPEHSLPFREFLHARANLRVKAMYSGTVDSGRRGARANPTGHLRNESEAGVPRWTQERGQQTRAAIRSAQSDLRKELGRTPIAREISERIGINVGTVRVRMKELDRPETESTTFLVGDFLDMFGPDFLQAEDRIDSVMMAYHHGEIRKVVSEMEEPWKTYCYMRFWEGKTDAEVSRELPGWHKHMLYREVKPMLRQRLAHLVDA